MTFAARHHAPSGAASLPPLGSATVDDYAASGSSVGSISFNTDGTITCSDGGYSGPATWYGSTVVGIGSSYQVRFTLTSGDAWDAGLTSSTAYTMSSNRQLVVTAADGVYKVNALSVQILDLATGTVVTDGTLVFDVDALS